MESSHKARCNTPVGRLLTFATPFCIMVASDLNECHFGERVMKATGYIRVSTEEQSVNGDSLDTQRSKLVAYAALYDIELVEIIEDAGISAKSLERPGLKRALGMLRDGTVDGLLVAKLDRLSRSVGDWDALVKEFFNEKADKKLFSVMEAIDTRTATGRAMLNMVMVFAQWERETIAERTRDVLRHKASKNERTTRGKYGWDVGPDGVKMARNETEQGVIVHMSELRASGKSFRAIADDLNASGIPTKEGGKRWEPMTVSRVLSRLSQSNSVKPCVTAA